MATETDIAPARWALNMLLGATLFVGTVSFVMSLHSLYDLLIRVAGVPRGLAMLAPLGVDGLTLCAVAATHLLRNAPWRVRAYAWTVFWVPTGLSIAGQVVDARVRHLPPEGLVALATMPPLFALSAHLTVVSLRWAARLSRVPSPVLEEAALEDGEPDSDEPRQKRPLTPAQAKSIARRRRANNKTYEEIASGLRDKGYDVSAKTVERWFKPVRDAAGEQQPTDDSPPASADVRQPDLAHLVSRTTT